MALLTNHFCRFPLLHCGGAPPPSFLEHVCILLFHFWVQSTLVLFVPFWLFASFYSRFLYLFLRIVFSYLNWLVEEFKFSSECYIPVFFSCVDFFVEKGGIPDKLEGLLCLISLRILSDPWFLFCIFSLLLCSQGYVLLSDLLSETVLLQGWPLFLFGV